jgi:hypothetical protein
VNFKERQGLIFQILLLTLAVVLVARDTEDMLELVDLELLL